MAPIVWHCNGCMVCTRSYNALFVDCWVGDSTYNGRTSVPQFVPWGVTARGQSSGRGGWQTVASDGRERYQTSASRVHEDPECHTAHTRCCVFFVRREGGGLVSEYHRISFRFQRPKQLWTHSTSGPFTLQRLGSLAIRVGSGGWSLFCSTVPINRAICSRHRTECLASIWPITSGVCTSKRL